MTKPIDTPPSPNFGPNEIPVEFVILHYTATDLAGTLGIFADAARGVAAHFVIDVDGQIHDLGHFWDGVIRRGAHAGDSRATVDGRVVTTLNDHSIGIEIVNFNGNILDYPEAQYAALADLLNHLIARFPDLKRPGRILGHEHVAGFRGKCDPGLRFDWPRVLKSVGVELTPLHLRHRCTADDVVFLGNACAGESRHDPKFWESLSSKLEARVRARGDE